MKIVRYIIDNHGIVLIVEGEISDQMRAELHRRFDDWAQMLSGHHFPVIILPGDKDTLVTDLRGEP